MNQLQKSLRLNALFSGLSGILLVVKNKQIAHLFDSANTAVFWITGTALILFSFLISYEIKRQNPLGVLAIIIQDFLWILASSILLIFQPFEISRTGNSMIAVVALIVLLMAINQAKALAQTDYNSKKGRKQLSFERTFKASKQNVWKVISDVANYHVVAPNIDAVNVISGEGEGMVRSCSHGKDRWTETCSKWAEEAEYAFEVHTTVPDYPYPFKNLKGNWKMEEIDETQTKVIMVFEFEYKKKFQNWLFHPILRRKFSKTGEQLLANWQQQIEQK
ncbi:type II toxin-antitoxin system RatA family toxin [Cellulophaga baltica]|uniref:type II toxin-antitoxin system RatA family toxin n=1 Tax=Cellulophaga baltica TaxID=76594 RepID=UPI00249570CB|nr:SRPBCC family protein [Cellulophaga baltica]